MAAIAYQARQDDTDAHATPIYRQLNTTASTLRQQISYRDLGITVLDAIAEEQRIAYPDDMSADESRLLAAAQEEEDAFLAASDSSNPQSFKGRIDTAFKDYGKAVAAIRRDLGLSPLPSS
jgi:hypothetical protein